MTDRICKVAGCVKKAGGGARGMCPMHYARMRKHGSTQDPKVDNFSRYAVDEETGCWNWTGPKKATGYGLFSRPYEGERSAHRAFWVRAVDHIPPGMEVDHLCRNPSCVNPGHMEIVTHWENQQRRRRGQWGTETCLSGKHDVTGPDAWQVFPSDPDKRHCRACYQENYRRNQARRKAARESSRAPQGDGAESNG